VSVCLVGACASYPASRLLEASSSRLASRERRKRPEIEFLSRAAFLSDIVVVSAPHGPHFFLSSPLRGDGAADWEKLTLLFSTSFFLSFFIPVSSSRLTFHLSEPFAVPGFYGQFTWLGRRETPIDMAHKFRNLLEHWKKWRAMHFSLSAAGRQSRTLAPHVYPDPDKESWKENSISKFLPSAAISFVLLPPPPPLLSAVCSASCRGPFRATEQRNGPFWDTFFFDSAAAAKAGVDRCNSCIKCVTPCGTMNGLLKISIIGPYVDFLPNAQNR
jgi:hypothetical protein